MSEHLLYKFELAEYFFKDLMESNSFKNIFSNTD